MWKGSEVKKVLNKHFFSKNGENFFLHYFVSFFGATMTEIKYLSILKLNFRRKRKVKKKILE